MRKASRSIETMNFEIHQLTKYQSCTHEWRTLQIYTIILLMDTVSLSPSLTSVCGAYFWSLQTEFWADRFAKCLKMLPLTYFLYDKVLAL